MRHATLARAYVGRIIKVVDRAHASALDRNSELIYDVASAVSFASALKRNLDRNDDRERVVALIDNLNIALALALDLAGIRSIQDLPDVRTGVRAAFVSALVGVCTVASISTATLELLFGAVINRNVVPFCAGALALGLGLALNRGRGPSFVSASAFGGIVTGSVTGSLSYKLNVAFILIGAVIFIFDRVSNRFRGLTSTVFRRSSIISAFNRVPSYRFVRGDHKYGNLLNALDRARRLAGTLASALDSDRDLLSVLQRERVRERSHARRVVASGVEFAGNARLMPGRTTQGLVALAVWLLPVEQRPRYRAELSGELTELPRRQRWGYALRVLISAWQLRRALIEEERSWDGTPARRTER